jgi:RNA polymerase sigma factor (sigma-70 family)
MIRRWFQTLTRKFISDQRLRNSRRPLWRQRVSLRLESLEDRTVTSTFGVDAPGLTTATTTVNPPNVVRGTLNNTAGLDNLINALRDQTAALGPGSVLYLAGSNLSFTVSSVAAVADFSGSFVISVTATASVPSTPTLTISISATTTPFEGPSQQPAGATQVTLTVGTANRWLAERADAVAWRNVVPGDAQAPVVRGELRIAEHGQSAGVQTARMVGGYTIAPKRAAEVRPINSGTLDVAAPAAEIVRQVVVSGWSASPLAGRLSSDVAMCSARGVAEMQASRFAPNSGVADAGGYIGSMMRAPLADVPDGVLLQRFTTQREQAAFTALVQRHRRLVFGICQRVLGDLQAAEDVYQATFMLLARKANLLDRHSPLAGWLYTVAYRLALRLRAVKARQRRCERQALAGADRACQTAVTNLEQQELRHAVNEELQRLPEKYRVPLVMCYFDGRTHAEAAREMGLPRGSMAKRIGEGLERLRQRLVGRGLVL